MKPAPAQPPSTKCVERGRSAFEWLLRQWPIVVSMLVAGIIFSSAVHMYAPIPLHKDPRGYSVTALRLVTHGVLAYGGADPNTAVKPDAFVTPAYPLFLSAFYFFAPRGVPFAQAAQAVHPSVLAAQLVLAVATVGLIAACGAALGGSGFALTAGILAACYLPFGWSSSVAYSETFGTFLIAVQLLLGLRLAGPPGRWRNTTALLFGVTSALVALTRPAFVIWAVVPFLFLAASRRYPLRRLARLTAIAVVAFMLIMAPWWIRNAVSLHAFIPLSSNTARPLLDATGGSSLTAEEQTVFERAKREGRDAEQAVATSRLKKEWDAGPAEFVWKRARNAFVVIAYPWMASGYRDIVVNGKLPEGAVALAPIGQPASPALPGAEARTVEYHWWLVALAALGLLFVRRWPRLLIVASLPIYAVIVQVPILFINRYFFPAMPAVILLVAALLWGTILLACRAVRTVLSRRSRGAVEEASETPLESMMPPPDPRGRTLGKRFLLAIPAAFLTWLVIGLVTIPTDPFVIELGSDKPIAGSVSYASVLPWTGRAQAAIAPEQVRVETQTTQEVTVTVTPLGKVNRESKGEEVWLLSVSSPNETIDAAKWGSLRLPWPWRAESSAALNATGPPTPLAVPLKASGFVELKLLKHPWSGGVRIASGGLSRVADLYAPSSGEAVVRMLMPVPLGTTQKIQAFIPGSSSDFTLALSGGPRLVRLQRATWWSRQMPWEWDPASPSGMTLGPGTSVVERRSDGLLVKTEGETGQVTFKDIRRTPFFLPGWSDLLFVVALAFVYVGAYAELTRGAPRIDAAVRRLGRRLLMRAG